MKSYRKELWFNLPSRRGFVNITPEVEVAIRESGIKEGLALVNRNHITASTRWKSQTLHMYDAVLLYVRLRQAFKIM